VIAFETRHLPKAWPSKPAALEPLVRFIYRTVQI